MQTPQIFNFEQNDIRTVLINQEPHFVGVDVAKMLGFENSRSHQKRRPNIRGSVCKSSICL